MGSSDSGQWKRAKRERKQAEAISFLVQELGAAHRCAAAGPGAPEVSIQCRF